jgi:signal transduction histidine kinase
MRERLMYEPIDDAAGGHDNGLGLGLILSRKLIEQQNGELGFDSSDALGGARFTARFPLS